jgi:adenylate cyclase
MSRLTGWVRRFGLTRAICVLLLLALVPLRVLDPLPLEEIRLRTFDFYQILRPRQTAERPVTIVDIDEASLKEIGQWPWPRTIVADLVRWAPQCLCREHRRNPHCRPALRSAGQTPVAS